MVLIIGAGLAGLACAKVLQEAGIDFRLLETKSTVGGRLATTVTEEGFRLDHGFQVLLDSYPAVGRHIDLAALRPGYFDSGALFYTRDALFRAWHPLRHPTKTITSAFGKYATVRDKMRLVQLAASLVFADPERLLKQERFGVATEKFLRGRMFSSEIIEDFFRPFFGGVLIDNELATDSGLFQYYFQKFIVGKALLPDGGIQEIPKQIATHLPLEKLFLNTSVDRLEKHGVLLTTGESLAADHVVLAIPQPEAARLLHAPLPRASHRLSVCYFESVEPVLSEKLLVLPSGKDRHVRHFAQVSQIAPGLAPPGRHLLSATVLGDADFKRAHQEIATVFPSAKKLLKPLQIISPIYTVPPRLAGLPSNRDFLIPENVTLCGDFTVHGSIEGALVSGERAAKAVIDKL